MPIFTLLAGGAVGGLLAAYSVKCASSAASSSSKSKSGSVEVERAHEDTDACSAQDAQLFRELQDDVALRLRRIKKLPPGDARREAAMSLRRQYSLYSNNDRLRGLLAKLTQQLERSTRDLLEEDPTQEDPSTSASATSSLVPSP